MHPLGLSVLAILLTWHSIDPTRLVMIERRQGQSGFQPLVTTVGESYTDYAVQKNKRYCYRARFHLGTDWTPPTCVMAPKSEPTAFQGVPLG